MPIFAASIALSLAQTPHSKTLFDCAGRDFPAYALVLKAKPEHITNVTGDSWIYRGTPLGVVSLFKPSGSKIVEQVMCTLPLKSKKSWPQILTLYGIKPTGCFLRKKAPGRYEIPAKGRLPQGWDINWQPGSENGGYDRFTLWKPIRIPAAIKTSNLRGRTSTYGPTDQSSPHVL